MEDLPGSAKLSAGQTDLDISMVAALIKVVHCLLCSSQVLFLSCVTYGITILACERCCSRQVKQIGCQAKVRLLVGKLLAMQGPVNSPGTNYSFYAMVYMVRSLQPSKSVIAAPFTNTCSVNGCAKNSSSYCKILK